MGDLDSLGPWVIGILINVMLYGVMVVQTFEYYRVCGTDFKWVKWMVAFLFVADTFNTGLNIADLYYYCVTLFGNFEKMSTTTWMGNSDPAFTAVIASVVQLFYAWRIIRLTNLRWVFGFIVATSLTQCAAGIAATVSLSTIHSVNDILKVKNEVIVWMTFAMVTDFAITATLVGYLRDSRTGFAITDDVISKIVRMTVQTGFITTVWAIIGLVLYLIPKTTNYNFIFTFALCKLYTNTLLSTLTARPLREIRTSEARHGTALAGGRPDAISGHGASHYASHTVNTIDVNPHHTDIKLTDLGSASRGAVPAKSQYSAGSATEVDEGVHGEAYEDHKAAW